MCHTVMNRNIVVVLSDLHLRMMRWKHIKAVKLADKKIKSYISTFSMLGIAKFFLSAYSQIRHQKSFLHQLMFSLLIKLGNVKSFGEPRWVLFSIKSLKFISLWQLLNYCTESCKFPQNIRPRKAHKFKKIFKRFTEYSVLRIFWKVCA